MMPTCDRCLAPAGGNRAPHGSAWLALGAATRLKTYPKGGLATEPTRIIDRPGKNDDHDVHLCEPCADALRAFLRPPSWATVSHTTEARGGP